MLTDADRSDSPGTPGRSVADAPDHEVDVHAGLRRDLQRRATVESASPLSLARVRAGRPAGRAPFSRSIRASKRSSRFGGANEQMRQPAAWRSGRAGQLVETTCGRRPDPRSAVKRPTSAYTSALSGL